MLGIILWNGHYARTKSMSLELQMSTRCSEPIWELYQNWSRTIFKLNKEQKFPNRFFKSKKSFYNCHRGFNLCSILMRMYFAKSVNLEKSFAVECLNDPILDICLLFGSNRVSDLSILVAEIRILHRLNPRLQFQNETFDLKNSLWNFIHCLHFKMVLEQFFSCSIVVIWSERISVTLYSGILDANNVLFQKAPVFPSFPCHIMNSAHVLCGCWLPCATKKRFHETLHAVTVLFRGVRSLFGSIQKPSPWGNFSDGWLNQSIKRRLSL